MMNIACLTTIDSVMDALDRAESHIVLLEYRKMRLRRRIERAQKLGESLPRRYDVVMLELNQAIKSAAIEGDSSAKMFFQDNAEKLQVKKATLENQLRDNNEMVIHRLLMEQSEYELRIAFWEEYIAELEGKRKEMSGLTE
jgi:hypothetical protein